MTQFTLLPNWNGVNIGSVYDMNKADARLHTDINVASDANAEAAPLPTRLALAGDRFRGTFDSIRIPKILVLCWAQIVIQIVYQRDPSGDI